MIDSQPLVSVLMTAYNRQAFIAIAIESVLASTYTLFELIVVDDGSTDETVSIVQQYQLQDTRIKLYVNEQNIGDYPNRNKAASLANGKYIKYVDSDDYIYPHGLEIMVSAMEQFSEAALGFCSLKPDAQKPFPFALSPKKSYEYHFFGPGLFHKGPLATILLKSAFDSMGGFIPERMISDTDMWHRMALQFPVVLLPDGLVWQRRHEFQELSDQEKYIYEGEKIKWKYLLSDKCSMSGKQLISIKNTRLKRYSGFIVSGIKNAKINQAKFYMKCFIYVSKIKIADD